MKILHRFGIILLAIVLLSNCGRTQFSQQFITRYITDSNWLTQLSYVPCKSFSLQAGDKDVQFKMNSGGHYIYRERTIDEFIFTPLSKGILYKMDVDTAYIQYAEDPIGILKFVRNTEEDAYYLTPDTIVDERFVILYQNQWCISKEKNPEIKLAVQGIEITKVKTNRKIQKGLDPKPSSQNEF